MTASSTCTNVKGKSGTHDAEISNSEHVVDPQEDGILGSLAGKVACVYADLHPPVMD